MNFDFPSNLFRCLMAVVVLCAVGIPAGTAQEMTSTPTIDNDRISTAFEFYPAETGFGSYFSPTIESGDSLEVTVLLANTGDMAQNLVTYPVDAFTDRGGGFAAAELGSSPNEVTSWLEFPEQIHTIDVGAGIEQRFRISVPAGTLPGEYITAVAAEHADAGNIEGSENLLQKMRFVIPVMITVPGKLSVEFAVSETSLQIVDEFLIVNVGLENTGNVRVKPEGIISLFGSQGELIASLPVGMDSVYAHDETVLTVGMPATMLPGAYHVLVELADSQSGVSVSAKSDEVHIDPMATPEVASIQIRSSSVSPGPIDDNIQLVTLDASISNFGDPVTNAQLSLLVFRDGEQVERFPISQSLSLPQGETEINTRYIPAAGFTSGTWTFELLLETVDPSGAAVVVASQPIEEEVVIP